MLTLIDANGQFTKDVYDERDSLSEVWESPQSWTTANESSPSPKYVTAYQAACPDEGGDHLGNLTRVTRDSGGSAERVVDYTYDGLNRVRTETQYAGPGVFDNPLVMQTTYDANSNRATVIDQLSRTTSYAYDQVNRLTDIDFSDSSTPDVSYTYDANGSRLTMTDGTGQTDYTYDELGRLLSVTTPATPSNKTVGYRYDRLACPQERGDGLNPVRTETLYPRWPGTPT